MKSIKKLIVALSVVLGMAACSEKPSFEVPLELTPVFEITDIALTSGTNSASNIIMYTVYTKLSDVIAWQTVNNTSRCNKIDKLKVGHSLVVGDTADDRTTYDTLSFDEVYDGKVTVTSDNGELSSSNVKMRRSFEIVANVEDGVGTMKITEYDNSVAEYSITLNAIEEYKEVE